jgi:hypothetical protein
VEEDTRKMGCRNWLTAAQDRSRWRRLLEEAKALPKAVETMMMMMKTGSDMTPRFIQTLRESCFLVGIVYRMNLLGLYGIR